MRRLLAVLLIIGALTSCSAFEEHEDERGRGDAPVADGHGEDSPALVLNFPDTFSNVATKCIPNTAVRVLVTKHDDTKPPTMFAVIDPVCGSVTVAEQADE